MSRSSITVRFVIDEALLRSNPAGRGLRLEALDLEPDETLSGLFTWMGAEQERDQLRRALSFDLFRVHDNFLHYHSEDQEAVFLQHDLRPQRWRIPRPPLLEILADWEAFLRAEQPYEKDYAWQAPQPDPLPNPADLWEQSDSGGTAVAVHFSLDDRSGRRGASTDQRDGSGYDRLSSIFSWMPWSHVRVAKMLQERSTLSLSNVGFEVRCNLNEVKVWSDDDSDPDDYLLLSRAQFETMIHDWISFVEDPVPYSKMYPPSP